MHVPTLRFQECASSDFKLKFVILLLTTYILGAKQLPTSLSKCV